MKCGDDYSSSTDCRPSSEALPGDMVKEELSCSSGGDFGVSGTMLMPPSSFHFLSQALPGIFFLHPISSIFLERSSQYSLSRSSLAWWR